jgi:hypothetical protein
MTLQVAIAVIGSHIKKNCQEGWKRLNSGGVWASRPFSHNTGRNGCFYGRRRFE